VRCGDHPPAVRRPAAARSRSRLRRGRRDDEEVLFCWVWDGLDAYTLAGLDADAWYLAIRVGDEGDLQLAPRTQPPRAEVSITDAIRAVLLKAPRDRSGCQSELLLGLLLAWIIPQ
jgi:hypothetical protein